MAALVLAMLACAWQLTAYYAREVLPGIEDSGRVLDNFDGLAGSLPFASGAAGPLVGVGLAVAALVLLALALRRGIREPVVQALTAVASALSLAAPVLVPALAG